MAKARVKAEVDLDGRKFNQGVASAKTQVKSFSNQLGGVKNLVAGAFAVGTITSFTKSIIDLGSNLSDMADQAGLTTDEFQALELAQRNAGGRGEDIVKLLANLNKNAGAAQAGLASMASAFENLGINVDEFVNESGPKQLEILAKATSATEAYDKSMILGTKSFVKATELLRVLRTEGVEALTNALEASGQKIEADLIVKLDEAADRLGRLKRFFQATFAEGVNTIADLGGGIAAGARAAVGAGGLGVGPIARGKEALKAIGGEISSRDAARAERVRDIESRVEEKRALQEQVRNQKRQLDQDAKRNAALDKMVKFLDEKLGPQGTF